MSISKKVFLRLTLFSFLLAATAPTCGAMDVFLNLENIPGESRDLNHSNWIDVLSFSHGFGRGLGPVRPTHGAIIVQKRLDKSSPRLDFACNRGTVIPSATIEFFRLAEQEFRFYKIQLTNVVVSAVQDNGSSGGDVVEQSIYLEYESIQWSYTPQKPDGSADKDVIAWWDIPSNKGGSGVPTSDNDGDGIPDDTDPDDDNDGMTDVYENANGLNRFVNDSTGDLDQDGMSNYNEFVAGTAANNAGSVLRVTRTILSSGVTQITWSSVVGKTYEVYSSSDLAGPYTFYSSVSSGGAETSTGISTSDAQKYFRIRVLP